MYAPLKIVTEVSGEKSFQYRYIKEKAISMIGCETLCEFDKADDQIAKFLQDYQIISKKTSARGEYRVNYINGENSFFYMIADLDDGQ